MRKSLFPNGLERGLFALNLADLAGSFVTRSGVFGAFANGKFSSVDVNKYV